MALTLKVTALQRLTQRRHWQRSSAGETRWCGTESKNLVESLASFRWTSLDGLSARGEPLQNDRGSSAPLHCAANDIPRSESFRAERRYGKVAARSRGAESARQRAREHVGAATPRIVWRLAHIPFPLPPPRTSHANSTARSFAGHRLTRPFSCCRLSRTPPSRSRSPPPRGSLDCVPHHPLATAELRSG